ncbi:MAG: HlyD family efflux transporter periplasmic adaptor subunit [Clostridia bacterium]|jgi:hypothetical protein
MEEPNERKGSKLKTMAIITIVFISLYLTALFIWSSQKTVATDFIQTGEIENSVNSDAYIVRDEVVIDSTLTGSYIPNAEDGDKVAANYCIATVLNGTSESLIDQLKAKELSILKALQKKSTSLDYFSKDIDKIDTDIEAETSKLVLAINDNNITQSSRIQEEINVLMQKKAEIIGGTATTDPKINALKAERDHLKLLVEENRRQINTPYSGIISYETDGYEKTLKPSMIISATPQYLDGIKVNTSVKNVAQETTAGKPIAKVIKDINDYFLVPIETNKAKKFGFGEVLKIRINDIGEVVTATVYNISKDYNGRCVLSLKTDRYISETSNMRKINIDIIKNLYSGYKVQVSSLLNINKTDKTAEIVLVKFSAAKFTTVKLIGKNDTFAIIDNVDETYGSGVNLYDSYIINPINIQEGQDITK